MHAYTQPFSALQGAHAFQCFMDKVGSLNIKFHEVQVELPFELQGVLHSRVKVGLGQGDLS